MPTQPWMSELTALARVVPTAPGEARDTAFAALAESLRPRLVARAAGRFCLRDQAEDLAHEVCLRIQSRFETYDREEAFWPWARRILDNACVDYLRRSRRYRTLEDPTVAGGPPDPLVCLIIQSEFERCWRLLWLEGGYPHQQLAFAIRRMLAEPRCSLDHIKTTDACTPLRRLTVQFFADWLDEAGVARRSRRGRELSNDMAPLCRKLKHVFEDLLNPHDSRDNYRCQVLRQRTGQTTLACYVKRGPLTSEHLSNWIHRVRQRVEAAS